MYLEWENVFRRKNIGIVGQKSFGVYLPAASTGLPELRAPGASNAGTIPASAASIADFQRAAANSHYATSEVARSGGNRGSLVSSKQQQQPLWIDRRWNGADFEKGCDVYSLTCTICKLKLNNIFIPKAGLQFV